MSEDDRIKKSENNKREKTENDKRERFEDDIFFSSYSGLTRVSTIFISSCSFMDLRIKSEDDKREEVHYPVSEDDRIKKSENNKREKTENDKRERFEYDE